MAVYKIFIASSMSQAHRQNITKTIDEVNEILRPTFKYDLSSSYKCNFLVQD